MHEELLSQLKESYFSESNTLVSELNRVKELLGGKCNENEILMQDNMQRLNQYEQFFKEFELHVEMLKAELNV